MSILDLKVNIIDESNKYIGVKIAIMNPYISPVKKYL